MLGRFDPMKGNDEFLKIFAGLAQSNPNIQALVVGSKSTAEAREYLEKAAHLGVASRLTLLDSTEHPESMLNALDVLVSASLSEGLPNVVLEALLCGTPCVAYEVGDIYLIDADHLKVVTRGQIGEAIEKVAVILSAGKRPIQTTLVLMRDKYGLDMLASTFLSQMEDLFKPVR